MVAFRRNMLNCVDVSIRILIKLKIHRSIMKLPRNNLVIARDYNCNCGDIHTLELFGIIRIPRHTHS